MTLVINALLATVEIMALFFSAFFAVFILAMVLMPIETGLSRMVWKHHSHEEKAVPKPSFREFSQRHR